MNPSFARHTPITSIRYIGAIEVKGKTEPLRLWEVLSEANADIAKKKVKPSANFRQAMELFEDNQKEEAYNIFSQIRAQP